LLLEGERAFSLGVAGREKNVHERNAFGRSNASGKSPLRLLSLAKEEQLGSTTDKINGTANQTAGKIKQGVGEATDDPALKGEGKVQEAKGDLQKAVGNAKSAIKKAADL
jgi:uncharacterized protein YjbJ (UPF0337 family)